MRHRARRTDVHGAQIRFTHLVSNSFLIKGKIDLIKRRLRRAKEMERGL